ncbi:hypothetical protein [Phocaeicola vulgatus]|uniref:hypothetical protein n=1 Tax=Phocaeicola vulgatus TaxID=821 RepID=UPI001F2AA250|nr:hypothetical protein [Phocaeicola vulgatus]
MNVRPPAGPGFPIFLYGRTFYKGDASPCSPLRTRRPPDKDGRRFPGCPRGRQAAGGHPQAAAGSGRGGYGHGHLP